MEVAIHMYFPPTFWHHGGGETIYKILVDFGKESGISYIPIYQPASWLPEILHIIGSNTELGNFVESSKSAGVKKVVVHSIWYSMRNPTLLRGILGVSRIPWVFQSIRNRCNILKLADTIIANSEEEALKISRVFDIPPKKISVIYLPVANIFFEEALGKSGILEHLPSEGYILEVARINPRKNQLLVMEIAEYFNMQAVFVGKPDPSNPDYFEKFMHKIHSSNGKFRWLGQQEANSVDLATIYKKASIHVLPSENEFPGISSMESLASGTPIVVAEAPVTNEYFANLGHFCKLSDKSSIIKATKEALESGRMNQDQMQFIKQKFSVKEFIENIKKNYGD